MDDLKRLMTTMAAAVQDLQVDTKANTRDLQMLAARSTHMDATLAVLAGTMAGLGTIVEKVLTDQATIMAWWESAEKRIQALEQQRPPAA